MPNNKVIVKSPGIVTLLFITFLVLKLCSVINWSWWWVTAPLWIPVAMVVGFFVLVGIVMLIALLISILIGQK